MLFSSTTDMNFVIFVVFVWKTNNPWSSIAELLQFHRVRSNYAATFGAGRDLQGPTEVAAARTERYTAGGPGSARNFR